MRIEALWRYPFKSMAGEKLQRVVIGEKGIPGDRTYALRQNGVTQGAKKFPELMSMRSWYESDPDDDPPMVELEDGRRYRADDERLAAILGDVIDANIEVSALAPGDDLEFYRRRERRSLEETKAILGLEADEPLPDVSGMPDRVREFATPPGTFFDCYPLLVMTTASLEALQEAAPTSAIDVRRFRPNILVDTDERGFVEQDWVGRRLQLGNVIVSPDVPCPRCVMTTIGFHDLPKDPKIMRTLVATCNHELGVYAEVEHTGTIEIGDEVKLL